MTRTQKTWAAIYFIALAAILAVIFGKTSAPEMIAKPDASTCPNVDGWSAKIEPVDDDGWACVMRRGRVPKTFFYGRPI